LHGVGWGWGITVYATYTYDETVFLPYIGVVGLVAMVVALSRV